MLAGERAWVQSYQWLAPKASRGPHCAHTRIQQATTSTRAVSSRNEPRHLIMLVNGLAGSSANWFTVMERLTDLTDPRVVLPVPSEANAGRSGTVQLQ